MKILSAPSDSSKRLPTRLLPCVSPQGVNVFALTADQRYIASGSTDFLRTHFPITLQSHRLGLTSKLSENDLLAQLLHADGIIGNRVTILYGAAGSGKSEMLRWVQTQVQQEDQERAQVMIRISRTDLDVFHIFQRFQHLVAGPIFQEATRLRWEECRQKPRTIAKILVLTALEQLLVSDDHINALYYQLIDIVQTNLELYFVSMSSSERDASQFIELFSREDLNQLLRDSSIPIFLEYETLRHAILKVFQDQLLEGLNFAELLKRVSIYIQEVYHQRPILLIDDLVQSINLFATDLLDYFITLEEGCWDILIGITPNSLDATLRGKELLERIQYLDTIDDRVQKIWLSDEYGTSSSFLNEENCTEYARLYLREYKRANQMHCNSSCPVFQRCQHLEPDHTEDILSPFNGYVLQRLFKSLPAGKGKVRYFTMYLREIFERLSQGEDILAVLPDYIQLDQVVHHTNTRLARIYELYGPFSDGTIGQSQGKFLSDIYAFFGIPEEDQHVLPLITSLLAHQTIEDSATQSLDLSQDAKVDSGKGMVKAWLQGQEVNKQLLKNVRRGVVKIIKDGYAVDCMTRLNTAKSNHILRWTQTRFDTLPPVQLAEVDDYPGLSLSRDIGSFAYLLYDYADTPTRMEHNVRGMLVSNEHFPPLMLQAMVYRYEAKSRLETQLGVSVEYLAFSLFLFARSMGHIVVELPPAIESNIGVELFSLQHYPESLERERPRLTNQDANIIRHLFDDCFKLRENIYDGLSLARIVKEIDAEHALGLLKVINVRGIEADFRLNELSASKFISEIQRIIEEISQLKEHLVAKTVLASVCSLGLGQEIASQKLSILLGLPGDTQKLVDTFVQTCTPLQLHKSLLLASIVDALQYERGQEQLRNALKWIDRSFSEKEQSMHQAPTMGKYFTHEELSVLVKFSHQGFRLSVDQFDGTFLMKIAEHFPDFYKLLEVRLQRG